MRAMHRHHLLWWSAAVDALGRALIRDGCSASKKGKQQPTAAIAREIVCESSRNKRRFPMIHITFDLGTFSKGVFKLPKFTALPCTALVSPAARRYTTVDISWRLALVRIVMLSDAP